ncbi:MAG: hypothetical protein CEN92_156 [Candidatus Berkelbacteria bacterium Licking1014_96]|uniref:HTH HARE-type domain-containing protein n=1 Tax=Candidatus Berkelbacteria bacterium Licking1014_96 TaxID=2017149 RepID=A0A554LGS2_9BACT|nr:MAG: hypothetical protein CEN92_156 [Candidatus Berkelbacteria bacterium Licking1014_96]
MGKDKIEKQVKEVLATLKEKEKRILIKRFGLFGEEGNTLAAIGKDLKLTRERIRQIQNHALQKIKKSPLQNEGIFAQTQKISRDQGGIISTKDLKSDALFILEASQNLKKIKGHKSLSATFIAKNLEQKDIINLEKEIIGIFEKGKKAIKIEKLLNYFAKKDLAKSLIFASSAFAFDWKNRVGLSLWREINPRSARDKAYYILKKEERPLHFTHIALLISEESFLGKNPTAATVHNELILDDRFVLVGRGIYALAAWGFRGGTVEEVIKDILAHHPKGMERDAIIEEVLKTKLVARNTVMMNLLVKKQFVKNKAGKYKLVK